MTVTVILTLLFAKIKGLRLKPLFKAYYLYPIFLYEFFGLFLQLQIFCGNYSFAACYPVIKTAYMLLYIIPVIGYKLYVPGLIGSGFVFAGTLLNKVAMVANEGKMPVFPSLTKLTGYFRENMFDQYSTIHVLGSANTKLKFLCDVLDTGYSILSVGDLLIRVFVVLILFYALQHLQGEKEKIHANSH